VIDLGAGQVATSISADCGDDLGSNFRTCVVLAGGALKCWGNNESGELGQGDTMARGGGSQSMGDALLPIAL
jgi:hypothetical protein